MREKIAIITNYYSPEMGAASNRIKNMAVSLQNSNFDVSVICPLPNYPYGKIFKDYHGKLMYSEVSENITIKRFWLFPSKSKNKVLRFLSMISFSFSLWLSLFYLIKKKPNYFIIQSPPLFIAFSSLLLSKLFKSTSILNVSDLWPLSGLELKVFKKGIMFKSLSFFERLNYRMADKIMTQSIESKNYIENLVDRKILVYRNVPKLNKSNLNHSERNKKFKLVYAGLLGFAQGVLEICRGVNFSDLNIEFHIYGAGAEQENIISYIDNNARNSIFYHGEVSNEKLMVELNLYDGALVPLRSPIKGALPSKIFEMISIGLPIIYVGCGEGKLIVEEYKIGLTSENNDYVKLEYNIKKLKKMKKEEFYELKSRCKNVHRSFFNLEKEIKNIVNFLDK